MERTEQPNNTVERTGNHRGAPLLDCRSTRSLGVRGPKRLVQA